MSGNNQRPQQPQRMTDNQAMSHSARLEQIGRDLGARRPRIEQILPTNMTFERFRNSVITALRTNPKLLDCTPDSILNASLESASDGLPCDGKLAAMTERTVNVGTKKQPKYEKHAIYVPMALGIRKKIIESGAAKSIDAVVVYDREHFRVFRGTSPRVEHEQILDTGKRGEPYAVYSVAELPHGGWSIETMDHNDIMAVREAAETKYIWDGPFGLEMWRKSVLRRHRKALVGDPQVRDAEERRLFAQFDQKPHPQLPAPEPRPERRDREAIADQSNDLPINNFGDDDREMMPAGTRGSREEAKGPTIDQAQDGKAKPAPDPRDMPGDVIEWEAWVDEQLNELGAFAEADEVESFRARTAEMVKAGPPAVTKRLTSAITHRLADIISGSPKGDAGAQGDDSTTGDGATK